MTQADDNEAAPRGRPGHAPDPEAAARALARFLAKAGDALPRPAPSYEAALEAIFGGSSFLRGLCERNPEALAACLSHKPDAYLAGLRATLARELAATTEMAAAMRSLRRYKQHLALATGLYDVSGLWDVGQVMAALSTLADHAVAMAVRFLLRRARQAGKLAASVDEAAPEQDSGYFVLAMGKLGAGELNYSSDIDLVVLYDAARVPVAAGVELQPFLVRLTRDLVRLLQERTADGYVFRTDLRLRPDPGSTQVALSTEAAFFYYESVGQNWERAAMIKARPIAGDIAVGQQFLRDLAPFIWRKYLDYAAIAQVHAMKRRVHEVKGHDTIKVAGHNLKLGRGGIRDIEFFVQTQQLIAGGRQTGLRVRQTLRALQALQDLGWISAAARDELSAAYCLLRHVEHRLQMRNDEQTHTLPEDPERLAELARFAGFADAATFADILKAQMRTVERHYAALFEELPAAPGAPEDGLRFQGDEDDPETLAALAEMGFADPRSVSAIVRGWYGGAFPAMRSETARGHLTDLLPHLLMALGRTAQPNAAIAAFDQFLRRLPAGIQLFALLRANPELMRLLADIMGQAPRLARVLARRPRLLDAVLDPAFFGARPEPEALRAALEAQLGRARDFEELLDLARILGREQGFLIGVRLLSGVLQASQAGMAYSTIAQTLLCTLKQAVEAEFAKVHGQVPGGGFAILAMGKLGGREMSASSDIDLIIIYEHADGRPESDGPRPLPADSYYRRLTQRLITAISAPTAQGRLYEVDMRLRPSGNSGPVATRFASFVPYQQHDAWTWEHLALTRARVLCGPEALCRKIEAAIGTVLTRPRAADETARDVAEMRERIFAEKGSTDIWQIKQVRGGLIDLEFLAQYFQLVGAARHPEILAQNTGEALERIGDAGLVAVETVATLRAAYRLFYDLTQILRLCLDGPFVAAQAPEGLKTRLVQTAGAANFAALEAELRQRQAEVAAIFAREIAERAAERT